MWLDAYLALQGQLIKFSRDLPPVTVGSVYHKKKVVAWTISHRSPDDFDIQIGQVICPIPDEAPFSRFVGMIVQSFFVGFKLGKTMVFTDAI